MKKFRIFLEASDLLEVEAETLEQAVAQAVDAMDHNREWHITVDEVE